MNERHEELASLYALGALPAKEARAFEAELARDPGLRVLVREMETAAAALAHAAPRLAPPANLEARLLAQIHAEHAAPLPFRHRDEHWHGWIALAACLALLAGFLALERARLSRQIATLQARQEEAAAQQAGALREQEAQAENRDAQFAAERARFQGELAAFRAKDALATLAIRTLAAQLDDTRQTLAAVVWSQEEQRGIVSVEKLRPPTPQEDYQLWVIDAKSPLPISAGL